MVPRIGDEQVAVTIDGDAIRPRNVGMRCDIPVTRIVAGIAPSVRVDDAVAIDPAHVPRFGFSDEPTAIRGEGDRARTCQHGLRRRDIVDKRVPTAGDGGDDS